MDPFTIVKNTLAINLEKKGYSLDDFENALSRLDTGAGVADVVKMASSILPDPISGSLNLAGSVYFPTTMAAGALVGLGVDKAEGTIKSQNKKLNEIRQNVKMLKDMKHNAEIEHHLNGK